MTNTKSLAFAELDILRQTMQRLATEREAMTSSEIASSQLRIQQLRTEIIQGTYSDIRADCGARALFRIDRAVAGYLGQASVFSSQASQRPKFMYIPGLPDTGFHDAQHHPCAAPLASQFEHLRSEFLSYQEAAQLSNGELTLQPFMQMGPGAQTSDYVSGKNPKARWDAVFFYRHGNRFDNNHALCPQTSSILEALPLVRLKNQTPEICFSVMQPGTTINAHHGVSNARLVLHIPLIIPAGANLELPGIGKHFWKEGEAMLFDDTFLHSAHNPANKQRVILLMDVWNHHLNEFEIAAFSALVETISAIEQISAMRE